MFKVDVEVIELPEPESPALKFSIGNLLKSDPKKSPSSIRPPIVSSLPLSTHNHQMTPMSPFIGQSAPFDQTLFRSMIKMEQQRQLSLKKEVFLIFLTKAFRKTNFYGALIYYLNYI